MTADLAHGLNGPSVQECVEEEPRQDIAFVTAQHLRTGDEHVMDKGSKKHHVTPINVLVGNFLLRS